MICILPYSQCQAETYQGEVTNDTHGTTGPIKVSIAKEHTNITRNFLEVSAAYDKRGLMDDINEFTSSDQYGVCTLFFRDLPIAQSFTAEMGKVRLDGQRNIVSQLLTKSRYIDIKTGRRSDTAHEYIYNQSDNINLTILDKSRVVRVIIEYDSPYFNSFIVILIDFLQKWSSCGGRIH